MDRVVNEVRLRGAVARVARGALVEIAEGRLDDDEGKNLHVAGGVEDRQDEEVSHDAGFNLPESHR